LILFLYFLKLLNFTTFSFFSVSKCYHSVWKWFDLIFIFYKITLFYYIFLFSIAKCVFLSQCKHQNTQFPFLLNSRLY
jgi:hypothetical protein